MALKPNLTLNLIDADGHWDKQQNSHCLNTTPLWHGGVEVKIRVFLTSGLDRDETSATRSSRSTPRKSSPSTYHRLGGWMRPTAGLDMVATKKSVALHRGPGRTEYAIGHHRCAFWRFPGSSMRRSQLLRFHMASNGLTHCDERKRLWPTLRHKPRSSKLWRHVVLWWYGVMIQKKCP
jgi:hypothetical protein